MRLSEVLLDLQQIEPRAGELTTYSVIYKYYVLLRPAGTTDSLSWRGPDVDVDMDVSARHSPATTVVV